MKKRRKSLNYRSNTFLTALSDSPTYLFNSSGPFTEIKLEANID